jgi:hypothetical protein
MKVSTVGRNPRPRGCGTVKLKVGGNLTPCDDVSHA